MNHSNSTEHVNQTTKVCFASKHVKSNYVYFSLNMTTVSTNYHYRLTMHHGDGKTPKKILVRSSFILPRRTYSDSSINQSMMPTATIQHHPQHDNDDNSSYQISFPIKDRFHQSRSTIQLSYEWEPLRSTTIQCTPFTTIKFSIPTTSSL